MKQKLGVATGLSRRLFAVDRPRIYYLVIPKCGCTYVKNVLWYIQHGSFHRNPLRVHDDDDQFKRASDFGVNSDDIVQERAAFAVLRNPIDRFLSLYFDKILGEGRHRYVQLFKILQERRGLKIAPTTLSDHQYNLELLADWLGENIQHEIDLPREAHWTPQAFRSDVMLQFNLKILVVEKLSLGLDVLLSPIVPGIRDVLREAERNRTDRDLARSDLLTQAIRRKVNSVYPMDRMLHRNAREVWKLASEVEGASFEVPRYTSIVPGPRREIAPRSE